MIRPDSEDNIEAQSAAASATETAGGLRHQLRLFFLALQFFTRLPIPRWVGFEAAWQRQALRYFPLIGAVVAACSLSIYLLAAQCWPQPVAVLLATAASILLTGAIHEDGLADCCDGMGAGSGIAPSRILAIMRDSQIGTFGMLGLLLTLALKCTALSIMPAQQVWAALLLAHPLSRLLCLPLIRRLSYVRDEGKAKNMAQQISSLECLIAVIVVLPPLAVASFYLPGRGLVLGGLLALFGTGWLARLFLRRIGGYSGDCLGAVQQVTEVLLFLGIAAVWPV
jgi:adenosylcobinamide-GDP ribazoletransferase